MTDTNKKKKRKFSWLQLTGILMILAGLCLIIVDFANSYNERNSIKNELETFLAAASNGENGTMPSEAAASDMWGTIEIEKLDVRHPIIISDNWDYLNRYVVAYPNGVTPPENGNFSIAGHNGRCASCVFRNFESLENGDEIKLQDKTLTTYVYKIYDIFEVDETDTSVLNQVEDRAILTLITCSEPSNYDTRRVIVKAELIESIPNAV